MEKYELKIAARYRGNTMVGLLALVIVIIVLVMVFFYKQPVPSPTGGPDNRDADTRPKPSFVVTQNMSAVRLETGEHRLIALEIHATNSGLPAQQVTIDHTSQPPGGVLIENDANADRVTVSGTQNALVHVQVEGAVTGNYLLTHRITTTNGELFSVETPVEVVADNAQMLVLHRPLAQPAAIAPSNIPTTVTFTTLVSGSGTLPAMLLLDEIDRSGNVLNKKVAELRDDGAGVDRYPGDASYAGTVKISGTVDDEKYYRVNGFVAGQVMNSPVVTFGITGLPLNIYASDPTMLIKNVRNQGRLFTNEVVMELKPGLLSRHQRIEAIATSVNGTVQSVIPALNTYLLRIESDGTLAAVERAINVLIANNEVTRAYANYEVISEAPLPGEAPADCTDENSNCQWYIQHVNIDQAWQAGGAGTPGISVAVLELSGIQGNHSDLDEQCQPGSFSENSPCAVFNSNAHGTQVAGVIVAKSDDSGIAGVAWDSKLTSYRYSNAISGSYQLAAVLSQVTDRIVNLSLTTAGDIQTAVENVIVDGKLIVAAAGNVGNSCIVNNNRNPAAYNDDSTALNKGIIAVGATDISNSLATWGTQCSNSGDWIDLYAPGKNIYTTTMGGAYDSISGTSLATPVVSGATALLWALNPALSAEQVHDRIINNATVLTSGSGSGQTSDSRLLDKRLIDVYAMLGVPADLVLNPVAPSIKEDCSDGNQVATITAVDPDTAETFVYSFTTAGGPFQLDPSSGVISVIAGCPLDYETTPQYNVTVRVTDALNLTYDETFVINVAAVTTTSLLPVIAFDGKERYTGSDGNPYERYRIPVTNRNIYSGELFVTTDEYGPCGLNDTPSRTWVDIFDAADNSRMYGFCALGDPQSLARIWFARPADTAPPAEVYIELHDRSNGNRYRSNTLAIP